MSALALENSKRSLFLFSTLVFVMLGVSGGLLNVAWTYMKDTFNVEVGAIGVLLLFGTSGSLLAALASGTLIGRFGLGWMGATALLILCGGLALIAVVPLWVMLLPVVFFTYIGRGLLDASMNNFVSENYGTTQMNWLHAGWGIGLTIAPPVMTFILVTLNMGWQAGYLLMAVLLLPMALVMLVTRPAWTPTQPAPPDTGRSESDANATAQTRATMRETLRQPAVLLSILVFFVYGGIEIGTGQLMNTLLVEGRAISQEVASLWLSLYWGSFTVGRIFLGWIALRLPDRVLLRGSLALVVSGAVLLMVQGVPLVSVAALLLIGFGLSGIFPTLISQTPARVGRRFAPQAIGFQIGFAGFGAAVLPGAIGYLAGVINLEIITYGLLLTAVALVIIYELLRRRYPAK